MKSPNELSFLPDDYLVRKARRRANILCAGVSIVVMGAIAAGFVLTERAIKALEQRHADVERNYTAAAKRIDQVNMMRGQQQKIVHRAELASSLVEKLPRSNLLAELTNSLPAGVSLLDLSMESKVRADKGKDEAPKSAFEQKKARIEAARKTKAAEKAKAKGGKGAAGAAVEEEKPKEKPKVYDVSLKLTGVADTDVQVAQFMRRLGDSRLLKDVNLVVTDVHEQGDGVTMRKFQIEMMLNPNAEIRGDDPVPNQTAAMELGDGK